MSDYQSLSLLSQEWLAKAREDEEYAKQEDISDEEASLYRNRAENYRACEERIRPFIAAGAVVVEPPKPYSKANECPSCHEQYTDGQTCRAVGGRGGCPMGGDF